MEKFGGSSAVMSLSNYADVLHIDFSIFGKIPSKQKIRQCIETPPIQTNLTKSHSLAAQFPKDPLIFE